jgi:hypothetical protein
MFDNIALRERLREQAEEQKGEMDKEEDKAAGNKEKIAISQSKYIE